MSGAGQDRAATSSSLFMRERPFTFFCAARAISACLVIPPSPSWPDPLASPLPLSCPVPAWPVSRCLAVFFATSSGWAENCLPFAVSARFLAVLRS